ncbi:MAG: DUF2726 domain-containing protein [Robiginitomaculum sp.]
MNEILFIAVLTAVLALVLWKPWRAPKSTPANKKTLQAYEMRRSVFVNGAEVAFFKALLASKPDNAHVFTKVRLEDILRVRKFIKDQKQVWKYRGRIKSRHVDFALCDNDGQFICVVELDGQAHTKPENILVDRFKDTIFQNAGLDLYRVKVGDDFYQAAREIWNRV